MDREEYKKKLKYISEHAKHIDYDWFDKNGKIIWVNDIQYSQGNWRYDEGFLAMDRSGKFCFIVNSGEGLDAPLWDAREKMPPDCHRYHKFRGWEIDWLFDHVSVNSLLWKVNRIYTQLA